MEHYVQSATVRWYNACAYYAVALARGLKAHGFRVTFVSGYETPAVRIARSWDVDVFTVRRTPGITPLDYWRMIRAYRSFALKNGVSLVNAHNGSDHTAWMLALAGTGIPVVRTSGNQIPPNVHPFSRSLMKKTAGVIASCNPIRAYYTGGFGMDGSLVRIINGGVDSGYFTPSHTGQLSRDDIGIPGNAFVFGILGRYSPDKGHRYFFDAAGKVAAIHPDAWFVVAGWNAQLSEHDIRSMAEKTGILDRTVFFRRLGDTRDLIGLLDVGVVASVNSETICRVAMEYMAMCIPVIGTSTNVIPEIVRHNETGLIIPPRNPAAMAEAMEHLLSRPEEAVRMGARGREIVESEYSLGFFARLTIDAYRSFLSLHHA